MGMPPLRLNMLMGTYLIWFDDIKSNIIIT